MKNLTFHSCCLKSIILPFLLAGAFMLGADDGENGKAEFSQTYSKPKIEKGYASRIDIPPVFIQQLRLLEIPEFTWEIKVNGTEDGKLAGALFKIFYAKKTETPLQRLFWKKKLSTEPVSFSGEFTAADRILFARLIVYNLNSKGNLCVESVRLTATGKLIPKKKRAALPKIDPAAPVPQNPLVFQPQKFTAGVYFYLGKKTLGKTSAESEQKFRECMQDIAAHHCNTVYLSGISGYPEIFQRYCQIAAENGLHVIAQGNGGLYIQPEYGTGFYLSNTLPRLRSQLPKLMNDNLIGFSVLEEPDSSGETIGLLRQARLEQKKHMPKVPTYTLHNQWDAMLADDDPSRQPDWYAFDMYRFKLHPERNVIMTPSKAAYRLQTNLGIAYSHAAKYGRPLIFVGQGVKVFTTRKSAKFTKASGMKEIKPGIWQGYIRYLPKYGMNMQFWLSVMSGCRGMMVYHYMSSRAETALVSSDLKPQSYWTEFGNCLAEAEPLFPLFNSWYKQSSDPAYATSSKTVPLRTFRHPKFKGVFILPVNTLIARWDKNNPILTNENTQLYSDRENLQGFEWAGPQSFSMTVKGTEPVFDLLSGKNVDLNKITLAPGKGRVFFQGNQAEADAVRKYFGIVQN